jgi:hypothetical protein
VRKTLSLTPPALKPPKLINTKWLQRLGWALLGVLLLLTGYGLFQLIEPVGITHTRKEMPYTFAGRNLLIASDADMVATAYADAKLERVAGIEDTLTLLGLPLNANQPDVATVQVSNSVMSWPQIIAVSPNGERAYVAEVRGRPADGIQSFETIDQMPLGAKVTVVDIALLLPHAHRWQSPR